METSHLITVAIHTGINLTLHVTLVDHRLRLSATHEGNNLEHLTGIDRTVGELDGIEVNHHVGVFGLQLHRVFLSTWPIYPVWRPVARLVDSPQTGLKN